ncbi:MAG: hypothetical protein BAJALOKI2v1_280037 [Promethearchaeota archaeon]|nr:MAG: hypothetical protein BAJALOKI2v1_280037 [Candidatus Lokiarchaeota archaeon]
MSIPSEDVIIQALSHSIRRDILRIVKESTKSYTQICDHFDVSRGKLNYHLNQMAGFIAKNEEGFYEITSLGQKAIEILNIIQQKFSGDDQPMIKKAYLSQKSKKESILLKGVNVWIALVILLMFIHVVIGIIAFLDSQTPWIIYPILIGIFGFEIYLLYFLIKTRNVAPELEAKIKAHLNDD